MIKRISLLCKLYDFCIRLRWYSLRINNIRIRCEFLYNTRANTHFRMRIEHRQLLFTAVCVSNVIAIHPGNQLIFAMLNSLVQSVSKPTILSQTDNIQCLSHFLLFFSNNSIQPLIQWTITHQYKIICGESLLLNALYCLF